jgi:hypothetical protein
MMSITLDYNIGSYKLQQRVTDVSTGTTPLSAVQQQLTQGMLEERVRANKVPDERQLKALFIPWLLTAGCEASNADWDCNTTGVWVSLQQVLNVKLSLMLPATPAKICQPNNKHLICIGYHPGCRSTLIMAGNRNCMDPPPVCQQRVALPMPTTRPSNHPTTRALQFKHAAAG